MEEDVNTCVHGHSCRRTSSFSHIYSEAVNLLIKPKRVAQCLFADRACNARDVAGR